MNFSDALNLVRELSHKDHRKICLYIDELPFSNASGLPNIDSLLSVTSARGGNAYHTEGLPDVLEFRQKLTAVSAHDVQLTKRVLIRDFLRRGSLIDDRPVRVLKFNVDTRSWKPSEAYFSAASRGGKSEL